MAKLTQDELQDHLRQQMEHLRTSSEVYDKSRVSEAVRLGTTVRILMHETNQSHSLLNQLGLRQAMQYVDTCLYRDHVDGQARSAIEAQFGPVEAANIVSAPTPSQVGMVTFSGSHDTELTWAPVFGSRGANLNPLATWWEKPAIETSSGTTFSRKQLVGFMANKDGGAHIDPDAPQEWAAFKADALGFQYADGEGDYTLADPPGGWKTPSGNVANASMRQIAWEIEQSILQLRLPWL